MGFRLSRGTWGGSRGFRRLAAAARVVRAAVSAGAVVVAVATGAMVCVAVSAGAQTEAGPPDRFDIVVIDPGHGGHDEGARGEAGIVEKDLVLDVSLRIARALRANGLEVVLTRETDDFVGLDERIEVANRSGADLFLSVHANSSSYRSARGAETFFAALEASDEASQELAARENRAFGDRAQEIADSFDPVAAILGDLAHNEHSRDSQEFAQLAQAAVARVQNIRSRGVKQAPFVVLMGVEMPAALIELGFVTNTREASALAADAHRDRLVGAVTGAVERFRERYDARRGLSEAESAASEAGR